MKVYMNGVAQPNFNFDSLDPVQGEAYKKPLGFFDFCIDYFIAIDVVLFGTWAAKWWYREGWVYMRRVIDEYLPWLLNLAEHGQMG